MTQTSMITISRETEHLFEVMNEAVAKLMAAVEVRHNVTLDEFVLTDIICDSIPADIHLTDLPDYHAGEIYQLCYQELVPHLQ